MSMWWRGFGVVEIVTSAALATAAAFAVLPGWMRANERAHLAKAASEMHRAATGLTAHFIDYGIYPPCGAAEGGARGDDAAEERRSVPGGVTTANSFAGTRAGARRMVTFRLPDKGRGEGFSTLTTPVAYMDRLPSDPFAYTRGASLGYFTPRSGAGWIVWSLGPDRDENAVGGPGEVSANVEILYKEGASFPYKWRPSPALIEVTYDPSNGTFSSGDLWRVQEDWGPGSGQPGARKQP